VSSIKSSRLEALLFQNMLLSGLFEVTNNVGIVEGVNV
jgi:hypothetical protein